jgi:hypothetical protein
MSTRRYEVLLPARFNDGHEVVETSSASSDPTWLRATRSIVGL